MSGRRSVKLENNSKQIDLNEMCRLCLSKLQEKTVNIFDSSNEKSLLIKIIDCTGVVANEQDSLPKHICRSCHLQLEKSLLFRNKCKNSDSKLKRHIRLINAGKVSKVFDDSEDEYEDDYTDSIQTIESIEQDINQKIEEDFKERLRVAIENEKNIMFELLQKEFDEKIKTKLSEIEAANRSTSKSPVKRRILSENSDEEKKESKQPNNVDQNVEEENRLIEVQVIEPFEEIYYESDSLKNTIETIELDADNEVAILSEEDDSNAEYLDEESEEVGTDDYYMENILPAIQKTIASKSGIHLDEDTTYKISKKRGNEIEVECTTSDGKIFCVEMVMDDQLPNEPVEKDDEGDLKIFKCEKCDLSFSRRNKLISHEREHEPILNQLKCSYCGKSFPSNSTLARHTRVHTGEKPFKCNVCGRAFIQKEILKRHAMIHSGERPFKCAHCPKSFILKEALKQHINRNHTENPVIELHKCPLCPKSFCHSSGLSRHLLIHAGKTFKCDFCSKPFNDRSALRRHTASIHNVILKKTPIAEVIVETIKKKEK